MAKLNTYLRGISLLHLLLLLTLFSNCKNDDAADPVRDPEFIFSDIDLFWEVFDSNDFSSSNFQTNYIIKGTIGLQDYALQKNLAPGLNDILSNPTYLAYYNSIRENTLNLTEVVSKSQEALERLKAINEGTIILDVYFIVGSASAGGRISENGLLIAVEMFSSEESIDLSSLSEWHQNVIRNKTYLPSIVVHESIHIQQFGLGNNGTVLESSLAEGMADFISHKLLPNEPFMNEHLHTYGDVKEEEIWLEFEAEMNLNRSGTEWLYTGATTANGHPADMGYYVGYKIYESFSSNYSTTEEAIQAILSTSYSDVFDQSGYADKFN